MAQCVNPISLPNPYGSSARDRITVPCGKCIHCLENRRADWSFRLYQEMRVASSAFFLTLTYDDDNIPMHGEVQTLCKKDVQDFLKRLRKKNEKYGSKIRYYLVGEYGTTTQRPHYHLIMFNLDKRVTDNVAIIPKVGYWDTKVSAIWSKGVVHIGSVEPASIHYVTGYVLTQQDNPEGAEPVFCTMSRNPGIGQNYVAKNIKHHRDNMKFYVGGTKKGRKQKLPRFYKNQMFSKDEIEMYQPMLQFQKDKSDEKFEKRHFKRGENPFAYRTTLIENKRRRINKNSKKCKI